MQDLDTLLRTDNTGVSEANAVSADGSVIVGGAGDGERAFVWTEEGEAQNLGTLRTDNRAILSPLKRECRRVGYCGDEHITMTTTSMRFVWTEDGGMQDLGTLRRDNRGTSRANGVSANGSIIVGRAFKR